MAETWAELLSEALVEIGVKTSGEALDADESADALSRLKGMLGEWSMKGLLVPGLTTVSHTVTEAKAVYTLGPSTNVPAPDINLASPVEALYAVNYRPHWITQSRPIEEVSYIVLSEIRNLESHTPRHYYYDRNYPLARILFDRMMEVKDDFSIAYRGHFQDIAAAERIDAKVPQEFSEPIMLNLAVKLAPSYGVKDGRAQGLSSVTIRGARDGIRTIRSRNLEFPETRMDPALRNHTTSQLGVGSHWGI